MIENKNGHTYLISIDGSLKLIPNYLVNDLQKKGWSVVINPKRTYYPEHDQTSPHYKKTVSIESFDTLPVELV